MKVARRRGRWVLDFYDHTGRRRWKTFRTRDEAKDAEADIRKRLNRGTYVAPTDLPTFRGLAEEWLAGKSAHRPASRAQWRMHLDRHLLPEVGDLRLDRLTVERVEALRAALAQVPRKNAKRPLGPRTVNKVLTTGSAICQLAMRKGLIERNPFALVERLREDAAELSDDETVSAGPVGEADVYSAKEITRILAATQPGRDRTLILTGYLTGARPAELLALQWSDVDFSALNLTIRRAFSWVRAPGDTSPVRARVFRPKTKAGVRTIDIPPELVSALKVWKLACPPSEDNLLFPGDGGGPLHRSTALKGIFYPALRRAEVRRLGMKTLRHSHASALLLAGAPITYVQHRLGHASPAVTLKVYSHWIAGAQTSALTDLTRAVMPVAAPGKKRRKP